MGCPPLVEADRGQSEQSQSRVRARATNIGNNKRFWFALYPNILIIVRRIITAIVWCDYWSHNDRQSHGSEHRSLVLNRVFSSRYGQSMNDWFCLHKRSTVWPIHHYYVCASKAVSLQRTGRNQDSLFGLILANSSSFQLVDSVSNFIGALYGLNWKSISPVEPKTRP